MAATPYKQKLRRHARSLPIDLLDHCTLCLEEALYSHGLTLLTNSLASDIENNAPACLPPPQHLAYLATISIHPNFTTRTHERDRQIAADDAFKYLRSLADTVDITESNLREALRFRDSTAGRRGSTKARSRKSDTSGSDEDEDKIRNINSPYSDKQSLWASSDDFWAVLGWALNCSVRHKARWERWRLWLELTLDVLEADMQATAAGENDGMRNTLMYHYLSTIGEGRNNKRRIMRAVTADGSAKSMAEFGEVWLNETKPPKKRDEDGRPSKRQKLDLQNDEFGDYFDEEEDEEQSQQSTRQRRSRSSGKSKKQASDDEGDEIDTPDEIEQFGGMDSIRLRQRILVLLTRFSKLAPSLFMSAEDLFEVFTEFLRPLPLAAYQQFILPIKPYFDASYQVALNELMFQPLLGLQETNWMISQLDFESRFAPSTAINTTAIDNAKVSLLAESILRALWKGGQLSNDLRRLRKQVEKGIQAREDKVAYDGRRKTGKKVEENDQALTALRASAERMRVLVDVISAGD